MSFFNTCENMKTFKRRKYCKLTQISVKNSETVIFKANQTSLKDSSRTTPQ